MQNNKLIWVGSDFHFEKYADNYKKVFEDENLPVSGVFDYLALAGDMAHSRYLHGVIDAIQAKAECPIFYTPGNHEFYDGVRLGLKMSEQVEIMREACENLNEVHFLYNEGMDIPGSNYSIFGSPWYTDFNWWPEKEDLPKIHNMIADYRTSLVHDGPLTYQHHIVMNQLAQSSLESWLETVLSRGRLPLIMTHFGPSQLSKHGMYPGTDLIASYFCTDYLDRKHDLYPEGTKWIHGHTHWNVEYKIGNVEVVTNQYGYGRESYSNETFNPLKYIKV